MVRGSEIIPVKSVDGYPAGSGAAVGPITQRLVGLFEDVVRGIDGRYEEWRTPVWVGLPRIRGPDRYEQLRDRHDDQTNSIGDSSAARMTPVWAEARGSCRTIAKP